MQSVHPALPRSSRRSTGVIGRRRFEPHRWVSAALGIALLFTGPFVMPAKAHGLTIDEVQQASKRISAGDNHSLMIGQDGGVLAWGDNFYGQCDVPAGLKGVVAVSAGYTHSLALRSDGTVVSWGGLGGFPYVPPNTTDAVAIAAGYDHSLVLAADGTVTAAGSNNAGKSTVPGDLSGVIAVAAGYDHSVVLRSDGTVVAWGSNASGQCTVPSGLDDAVAISAGGLHTLALRSDGTVAAWGRNSEQQCTVPAGLDDVVAVSAGLRHSLALRSDGTVVAWGGVTAEFTDASVSVPAGLTGAVAIGAGGQHSLAALSTGSMVGWGANGMGQSFGITSIEPSPWSTDIPADASFTVGFSAPVQAGTAFAQVSVKDSAGKSVAIETSVSGSKLTIKPKAPLGSSKRYTVVIPASAVKDAWGNVSVGASFDYSTPDMLPPVIMSINPPDGARGVALDKPISVTFDEGLVAGPAFVGIVLKNAQGTVVPCVTAIGGSGNRVLSVTPQSSLTLRGAYSLTIPAGAVQDVRGNQFEGRVTGFSTGILMQRIAGSDRVTTAIEISKNTFQRADTVIVATALNFPDALAAAPLAHAHQAPILLVPAGGVPDAVSREITRLGAKNAVIIGGSPAVPASVESGLRGRGLSVKRVAGRDRYSTAVAIAHELRSVRGVSGFDKAYIATGEGFSDALSVAGVAAAEGAPILLVKKAALPSETKSALSALSVKSTVVLGGTSAVSGNVAGQLPSPLRLAGADRFSTGIRVAEYAVGKSILSDSGIYVSTGLNYPDALAVGPAAASTKQLLLLVSPTAIPAPVGGFVSARGGSISAIKVVGGTSAVSESVAQKLRGLVE